MTRSIRYARTSATAIAAAVALSSTAYASSIKPIVEIASKPAPAAAPAKSLSMSKGTALELGGGAVAILILGGAAYGVSRRRRRADEAAWDYDQLEPVGAESDTASEEPRGPAEPQPAMVAPPISAFAWGNRASERETSGDRRPGESWVERAYRGPSAENPSLSLRKRLKRAAFFDKREREAAAGDAAPVDADAGLPEAVTDDRMLEAA